MHVIQFIVLLVLSIHFHRTCQATKIPTTQSIADQITQSTTEKEFPLERATRISSDRNKGKRFNNIIIIIIVVAVCTKQQDANDGILI